MNVFDSSAIYKAIKTADISILEGSYTVFLSLYELGNIVLKNSVLERTYSSHEAQELLKVCRNALNTMRVVTPDDLPYVYQIASRYQLSFYDSTYVCLAKELNLPLVTLDKKLANKVHSFIKAIHFDHI